MSQFIQMPEVNELKSELATARNDIQEAVKEMPELQEQSTFLIEVLEILNGKIANKEDLNALPKNEQISILAHLNLFYNLLEDIFGDEFEDFEDEDLDDEDLYDFEDAEEVSDEE